MMLPDELHAGLRRLALERGVSVATVVREALTDTVARSRPVPRSLGIASSGTTDTARRSAMERPEPRSWR
jgi:hypothetical protein